MTSFSALDRSMEARPALINRQADFWLLGGASIAFWALCHLFEFFHNDSAAVQTYLTQIPALFGFTSLIVNAPHFMASYHLAYSRGRPFILQNWFQLVLVPISLVVVLLIGDLMFAADVSGWRSLGLQLNLALEPLGIFIVVGTYSSLGPELLHHLINLMYLTVGWHYTKQVFGCFMVYSRFDGYELSRLDRNLIKASLLSIWGFNFFSNNSQLSQTNFFSAGATTHLFPAPFYMLFQYGTLLLFFFVAYQIFYKHWKTSGQLPPAPAIVAWLAMFIWWMPFARSLTFFLFAVPFFHSLQYLPFYKKVIDSRHRDPDVRSHSFGFYILFLIAAGMLAFSIIPEMFDTLRNSEQRFALNYWLAGIALLINIHHFFIDNAIWRLRDQKVRGWLLS